MTAMIDSSGKRAGVSKMLGLLLALWVSLAVQPCAVASVAEHECPHCPTEIKAAPGSEHHHGHSTADDSAAMLAGCGAMQAECCEIDDRIVGVRTDAAEFDDDGTVLATGPAPPGVVDVPRARPELAVPLPQPTGRFVRLYIINCVFLI
jgi:hypothetical protein